MFGRGRPHATTASTVHTQLSESTSTSSPGTFSAFPEDLFLQLSGSTGGVGVDQLKQWDELQELIDDGDLSSQEVEGMLTDIVGENAVLDQAGFAVLYEKIDSLFVYEEDQDQEGSDATAAAAAAKEELNDDLDTSREAELLSLLQRITHVAPPDLDQKMYRLPCGMECTDEERGTIATLVSDMEASPENVVVQQNGKITVKEILGDWELLYTNSKAMIINKSLSGLMESPGTKADFSGVRQRYTGSK